MLLSVFGTPSALMYGGLNVVRNLVELGIGAHKLVNANSTVDLRKTFAEIGVGHDARTVFYSDLPDVDLCTLFIKTRAPMIVFMDAFDDVVAYVSRSRAMNVSESIRLASRSLCALEPLLRSDVVLKFNTRAYRSPLKDLVPAVGAFFELALPAAKVDEIVSSLFGEGGPQARLSDYLYHSFPDATPPGTAIHKLAPDDRRLVSQLGSAYSAIAAGRPFDRMDWPVGLYMSSDHPDGPFPGRVELVGPSRFIAYGPYLHLTAGQWQATVVLELADNLSGNQLYVDVYAGEILSVITTELPAQGTFTFQIGFEITNPLEPVQLRFQIQAGAIEGVFTLNSTRLERVGEVRSMAAAGTQPMEARPAEVPG
jgi:hypothetical protein